MWQRCCGRIRSINIRNAKVLAVIMVCIVGTVLLIAAPALTAGANTRPDSPLTGGDGGGYGWNQGGNSGYGAWNSPPFDPIRKPTGEGLASVFTFNVPYINITPGQTVSNILTASGTDPMDAIISWEITGDSSSFEIAAFFPRLAITGLEYGHATLTITARRNATLTRTISIDINVMPDGGGIIILY